MTSLIKSVRGMHDLLHEQTSRMRYIENKLLDYANSFGYHEIRTPILEHINLFKRSAGEQSDIVTKEMYTFIDQNGDVLALRPEGTAACVRAGIQHGIFYGKKQRLTYIGNMFRRERPQKGRYRQFSQFGLEAIGFADSYIEVEIILLVNSIMQEFSLEVELELNHLGSETTRSAFTKDLVSYLLQFQNELDSDSQRRLLNNPLRILDSKDLKTQDLLRNAPSINDYLSDAEAEELKFVTDQLSLLGIAFKIQPNLVRGLDYYSGMVFEWQHKGLTICAGGRYDGLISALGGVACPAVGIAMGIERFSEAVDFTIKPENIITVACNYLPAYNQAMIISQKLRSMGLQVTCEYHENKMKPLLKLANQINSRYVILLGEKEFTDKMLVVKDLVEARVLEFKNINEFLIYLEALNV